MTTLDLKKQLIDKINSTQNDLLLAEVYRLLDMEITDEELYKLNEEQLSEVAEAREQFKNGEYYTDEEVTKEIDKWLNK